MAGQRPRSKTGGHDGTASPQRAEGTWRDHRAGRPQPWIARAQSPMRVGFLTVKTGPLASGGLQMEQGLTLYLKERNNTLAGRPVQVFTGDSRRRARGRAHQDAGAGRARQHLVPDRAARDRRGARDRRLHPRQADPDALGRGRRGPHAAQGEPVVRARELDLGAVQLSDGRLRGQGAEVQARRDDRRRSRLRLRAQRRLPARLRGRGRQGGAEALAAAQRARLRHLHRAAQDQRRRGLHGLRGLERAQVPAPVQGIRRQDPAARRHDGRRRVAVAPDGRRGDRHAVDQLLFGAARQPVEQEARRGHAARLQGRSRLLRGRRPTPTAPCSKPR